MIRLGATGSPAHLDLCRAPRNRFSPQWRGVRLGALFRLRRDGGRLRARGKSTLAWNGPLSHVKMRPRPARGSAGAGSARRRYRFHHQVYHPRRFRDRHRGRPARHPLRLCRSGLGGSWPPSRLFPQADGHPPVPAHWQPPISMTSGTSSTAQIRSTWPCRC